MSKEHAPLLLLEGLKVSYEGRTAVKNFSARLEAGEILGVVGESGSGKSTLIRAILGLLGPEGRIEEGRLLFQGKDLRAASKEELRALRGPGIGTVFQNAGASLCPVRRIEDQLFETVNQHEQASREEVRSRALELFEKIRLKDGERILRSYPFELSGGMNQRVGIVMAMILRPALLLADEPTSALDVTVQARVVRELLKLREEFHTGILLVTHNMGIVERIADQAAVMQDGNLVEYGRAGDVLRRPKEEYTRRLIQSVPRLRRG